MDGETIMITGKDYMVEMKRLQAEIDEYRTMLEIYMLAGRHMRVSISTMRETKALLAKHKGE